MIPILFPTVALKIGGAEQQLLELVRGLDPTRFRSVVAPLYRGGDLEAAFARVPGVTIAQLDRRDRYDLSVVPKLIRLIQEHDIRIVQPFVNPASCFGLLAAFLARTPLTVATERSGVRRYRHVGAQAYQFAEDRMVRLADVAVANSEAGRRLLIGAGVPPMKTRVIENGVNPERLRPSAAAMEQHRQRLGAAPGAPVVGILATLSPAKDHQTFLRAAAAVSHQRPDARFAIVGDGPLRAELEGFARDLGLADRATFFGFQRDVADLLALLDVLVSASRDNEGHSNSILEAMALGRPVVATDIGGNRELVRDGQTGLLVPCGDHRAMAAAIGRLLDHPAEAAALGAGGRVMIGERFTFGRMVQAYQTLYGELLARRRARLPNRTDHTAARVAGDRAGRRAADPARVS